MSVRLGHLLGANEPRKAKFCVTLSTCLATTVTILDSLLLYVYRKTIAYHFSTDPEVIEAIVQLLNIACLCHFVTVKCDTSMHFIHIYIILGVWHCTLCCFKCTRQTVHCGQLKPGFVLPHRTTLWPLLDAVSLLGIRRYMVWCIAKWIYKVAG